MLPVYGARPTGRTPCPPLVIAHLQEAAPHPEIAEYIERIPATFEPYGGRFLVHATQHEVKEGTWPGHIVMIGFPRGRRGPGVVGLTPRTRRSPRCAHATSRATSSWSTASRRAQTRPPPQRRCERPCPPSSPGQLARDLRTMTSEPGPDDSRGVDAMIGTGVPGGDRRPASVGYRERQGW
ncbi:DUF1330 domain-containing protein [Tsukamurella paurometabola]